MFALPLIYTMEMWWLGYTMSTPAVLGWVAISFAFATGLNQISGYRAAHGLVADLGDATVALALGLVAGAAVLAALGEIDADSAPAVALRQILLLAIPVSVGISLSRSLLPAPADHGQAEPHLGSRIAVAVAGAILLGLSAAPTEEIWMIATRISWPHLLAISGMTAALSWAAVHSGRTHGRGEVAIDLAIGLVTAAGLLAALGYAGGNEAPGHLLAAIVTLGLPTTLGAAVGRLVLR